MGCNHRRRCTQSGESRQEGLCDCLSACAYMSCNDLLVCACAQVPIKVNKTNCYVSIRGCFSSCCKFRGCTVYPTLFLVHVCVFACVCLRVCVFQLRPPTVIGQFHTLFFGSVRMFFLGVLGFAVYGNEALHFSCDPDRRELNLYCYNQFRPITPQVQTKLNYRYN